MRFKKTRSSALIAGLTLALMMAFMPAAQAAPALKIKKISNKTAPYMKSTKVKPSYKKGSKTKVTSARLTVKQGNKTIKKNAKSVKLKAGKYTVTQKVKYRVKKTVTKNKLIAKKGSYLKDYWSVSSGRAFVDECTYTKVDSSTVPATFTLSCEARKDNDGSNPRLGTFKVSGEFTWNGDTARHTVDGVRVLNLDWEPEKYDSFDAAEDADYVRLPTNVAFYEKVKTTKYGSTKTKTRKQTLTIKQGKKPGRTSPISEWDCPDWAPIKGNANSGIYHMPGQRFYTRTKPEDCFSSESAAREWGYRKAKV